MPSTSEIPVISFPGWAAPDCLVPDEEPELIPVDDDVTDDATDPAVVELSADFVIPETGKYRFVCECLGTGRECPGPGAAYNPVTGLWFKWALICCSTDERVEPVRPCQIRRRLPRPHPPAPRRQS